MAYSQDSYLEAEKIIDRRKEKANFEAQVRFDEISRDIPELDDIQQRLSAIGLSISKVFFQSEDKQSDMEVLMKESLALQEKKKKLLVDNGYDADALSVKYTCPHCNDTGFIHNRRCKCYSDLLKELERNSLKKIAPLDECTFDSFDTQYYPESAMDNGISPRLKAEKIKESCIKYAQGFSRGAKNVLFMGGTGLGKTHLSLAIANVVINKGYSVIYGTALNILNDLNNESFGRTDYLTYDEKAVMGCDLLIIDDLGTEFNNPYTVSILYNIINTRLLAKKPIIISTNLGFDEIRDKYDQRITSRIGGDFSTLILEGSDIRFIK